jgi:chromosome segregation ATPase
MWAWETPTAKYMDRLARIETDVSAIVIEIRHREYSELVEMRKQLQDLAAENAELRMDLMKTKSEKQALETGIAQDSPKRKDQAPFDAEKESMKIQLKKLKILNQNLEESLQELKNNIATV